MNEIRTGRMQTHRMWFVFPQLRGVGKSVNSRLYAIHSLEEAEDYAAHPTLGPQLLQCIEVVLNSPTDVYEILDIRQSAQLSIEEPAGNAPLGRVGRKIGISCRGDALTWGPVRQNP